MRAIWLGVLVVLAGGVARLQAGGGPLNTLILVNDNSPVSQELGQYYQDVRGLPERNIVHVRTTTNYTTDLATFTNEVVQPVRSYLAGAGLSNQIDYLVLTRDLPYRVFDGGVSYNGAGAVLFYGFKADDHPFTCPLTNAARSDYFQAESAFAHAEGPSSNRYYLSTVLTGYNLDQARRTVDRARQAESAFPTGRVALLHSGDGTRNVRWGQFDEVIFQARFTPAGRTYEEYNALWLQNISNVLGSLNGYLQVGGLNTVSFAPGALADHLTSYGGYLLDPDGQTSILDWLAAGAAGSYGTVVEPCAFTNKFPQAKLHYWYGRGFNLAESYTMAVQYPYMGLIVGDPLTAPYAQPPTVVVSGLVAGAVVTGNLSLALSASTTSTAGRVGRLAVFVDGLAWGTVTSRPPTAGNTVSVTVDGTTRTATVQAGDTLERVGSRLATAINNPPPFPYTARAYGDRVEIVQDAAGTSGAWVQVSATSATGSAAQLTVFARSVFTNLLESEVYAKEGLSLSGNLVTGDVLRLVISNLAGNVVTSEAVAVSGDTRGTLLARLAGAVNTNPLLQDAQGCRVDWVNYLDPAGDQWEAWLIARTNGWRGTALHVSYSVSNQPGSTLTGPAFADTFNDNAGVMSARATVFFTEGETNLQAGWTLTVTNLPDGPHELEVVAYEGSAVRVQGRTRIPFVVDRHALTCAITNPVAGRYLLRGSVVTAEVAAVSPGTVTQVTLYVEGKSFATTSGAPASLLWSTTNHGAGTVGLQAQAWDDGGRTTVSEVVPVQLYTDDDGDGLPDQWEYRALGSATNGVATDDPDGDGQDNHAEFLADTDPRDATSRYEVASFSWASGPMLGLTAATSRVHRVEFSDGSLLDDAWIAASNALPAAGSVTWLDAPTNAPAGTNGFRFYRVRAKLP